MIMNSACSGYPQRVWRGWRRGAGVAEDNGGWRGTNGVAGNQRGGGGPTGGVGRATPAAFVLVRADISRSRELLPGIGQPRPRGSLKTAAFHPYRCVVRGGSVSHNVTQTTCRSRLPTVPPGSGELDCVIGCAIASPTAQSSSLRSCPPRRGIGRCCPFCVPLTHAESPLRAGPLVALCPHRDNRYVPAGHRA